MYGMGLLTSAQTATLRQQAYLAARTILNTQGRAGTPENIAVSKLAEGYTAQARQRLAAPILASQIMTDPVFLSMAGKVAPVDEGGGGGWGFTDELISGIPNYALYGGVAALGALVFWKKPKGKKKRRAAYAR